MTVHTNIDVRAFNIITYLILNIVIDVIVRTSLDSFEHFRRRLSLHRGRPVSVAGSRIDRYNLLQTFKSRHVLPASLLLLITAVAYAVEVTLEYAIDSSAIRYARRGTIRRVEHNTGLCSLNDVLTSNNAIDMAFIAAQCVMLEDGTYRFFRPIWVMDENDRERVLCEAVEQNKLYEGAGIYDVGDTSKDSPDILDLVRVLNENAYEAVGDAWHSLTVVQVRSTDIFLRKAHSTPEADFATAFFRTNIAGTNVQCMGFTSGRRGHNTSVAQLVGCVNGYEANSSLLITYGTNFVQVGADSESEWSTLVSFEVRTGVPRYLRNVAQWGSTQADTLAYAGYLARSFPQDVINLNKYGVVYQYCDQVSLPVRNGAVWEEEYEFARSEVLVTATVEEWGIVLAVCWVVVVAAAQLVVSWVAARKKMPDRVLGERNILRRWAEENSETKVVDRGTLALLSVEERAKSKRITATLGRDAG